MFVKITKPPIGDNKESCQKLANYLSKEEGSFFDKNGDVSYQKAIDSIDKNTSQLRRTDDKFYMLIISPSHHEICHLIGRDTKNDLPLTDQESAILNTKLRSYTHDVMDTYANNFNRQNVLGSNDLVYFAKVETRRTYNHYDPEVKSGTKTVGQEKEGFHYHVHVVVSRKSRDGKSKLSPNAKSRGNEWTLNGKEVIRGFNHVNFKSDCINQFNEKFKYVCDYSTHFRISNLSKTQPVFQAKDISNTFSKGLGKINRHTGVNISKNFQTEKKIVNAASRIGKLAVNPKAAIANEVKAAFKQLLSGIIEKDSGNSL